MTPRFQECRYLDLGSFEIQTLARLAHSMTRNLGCMISYQAIIDDPKEFEPIVIDYFKQKLLRNANDQFKSFIVAKPEMNDMNLFRKIDRWLATKQHYYDLKRQQKQLN